MAAESAQFNIDTYIKGKISSKRDEYTIKYTPDHAQRRMEVYLDEIEDVRDGYNQELRSLNKKLDLAIKNNQDTCVIKSDGHRVDKMSKWGFVSNMALQTFLESLTQRNYKYEATSTTREETWCCEEEKDIVEDKCITIILK